MYNRFYGFSERPFSVTPDPRFLYLTPAHREALASMLYGINERRGFITVTGEVGTGKTTLIHALLQKLDKRLKTVFIFHTHIDFQQLLETIFAELHLSMKEKGKATLLRLLHEYLIERLSRNENVAVIIDEAHNLPVEVLEELRMLSNLETPKSKLLQILLVGQPELEAKLGSKTLRQLKQRIGIRRQIDPLSREESKEYIEYRLGLVGSSGSKVFTQAALSRISDYGKGVPRTINIVCDNAFLVGYGLSERRIDEDIIREVIADLDGKAIESAPLKIEEPPPGEILCSVNLDQDRTVGRGGHELPGRSPAGMSAFPARKKASVFQTVQRLYPAAYETLADLILRSNPEIAGIDQMKSVEEVNLPQITDESLVNLLPDNTYEIHLGTFATLRSARAYLEEESLEGKDIRIIPAKVSPHTTWWRIVAGQFDSKHECLRVITTLKRKRLLPLFAESSASAFGSKSRARAAGESSP